VRSRWLKRGGSLLLGGAIGFAYYHFIGCVSGTCPITSNPYISTAYGALIGLILAGGRPKKAVSPGPRGKPGGPPPKNPL
jgi:hypothetical protein